MKTTLQFKLSFMFFMVMLISATVSISLLLFIFSPIMRKSAEEQLSEMAVSINTLSTKLDEKEYSPEKVIFLVTNSSFTSSELKNTDKKVSEGFEELEDKGYFIKSSGIVPKASMIIKRIT